jgi:hypothetical protein
LIYGLAETLRTLLPSGIQEKARKNFPNVVRAVVFVIPAQAGNQNARENWFPACAGMT